MGVESFPSCKFYGMHFFQRFKITHLTLVIHPVSIAMPM